MASAIEIEQLEMRIVRAANTQWWTIFGGTLFVTGLILSFLSFSVRAILPAVPFPTVGSSFLNLSDSTAAIGIIVAALGLITMLASKLRLASHDLAIRKRTYSRHYVAVSER